MVLVTARQSCYRAEVDLGALGVWSVGIRKAADPAVLYAAAELEQLGYGTIWHPAGSGTRGFEIGAALLKATERITVATGITSIWATTPTEAAAGFAELERLAPGRFLLGLGVSHAPLVDRDGSRVYARPLARMVGYLEELSTVPRDRRIVAALGPKMLDLAARESIGTHPYLVTPAMTAHLRAALNSGPVIAVEQGVVLESDADRARAIAREHLSLYLGLPNYVNNWLRNGYDSADIAGGGSNRLVDDLVVWGDPAAITERIGAHYDAGATHVCVQVLDDKNPVPITAWRALAREIFTS